MDSWSFIELKTKCFWGEGVYPMETYSCMALWETLVGWRRKGVTLSISEYTLLKGSRFCYTEIRLFGIRIILN